MLNFLTVFAGIVYMFWNVENFFDPWDDPSKNDDDFTARGRNAWTFKRFETKCNSIAKTVLSAGGDYGEYPVLIGLAEVENDYVLKHLTEKSPLFKLEYGFIHYESPDLRGIDVALLYRKKDFIPLKSESVRVDIPNGNPTRDILYVCGIVAGEDTVHVFVNHWPSKLGGDEASNPRRQAAADVLKSKIGNLDEDDHIIVMGDFNDSNPFEDSLLVQLDVKTEGTIKFQGVWDQIDYFLVSRNMRKYVEFTAYTPLFLIEDDNTYLGVKPRRTFIGPRYNGGVSDHFPIVLIQRNDFPEQ